MRRHIKTTILSALFYAGCVTLCEAQTVFRPVTSASDLKDGDVVVIVSKYASAAMSKTITGTSSIDTVGIKFSGDNVLATDQALQLTLNESGSYWTLSSDNGYLCATSADRALTQAQKSKVDDYCKAKISINDADGSVEIKFKKKAKYKVGYNFDYGIFKVYETNYDNDEVYLYVASDVITLDGSSQTADNSSTIASLSGSEQYSIKVVRSFTGDGGWYTLCLPFALTEDDIATTLLGAELYEYKSVSIGALDEACLNFEKTSATEAGVPYLLKMKDGETVESPVFGGKTIARTEPQRVAFTAEDGRECSFIGIYDPTDIDGDSAARFVSAKGNSLAKSNGDGTKLNGLRAYFLIPATVSEAEISPSLGGNTSVPPPLSAGYAAAMLFST